MSMCSSYISYWINLYTSGKSIVLNPWLRLLGSWDIGCLRPAFLQQFFFSFFSSCLCVFCWLKGITWRKSSTKLTGKSKTKWNLRTPWIGCLIFCEVFPHFLYGYLMQQLKLMYEQILLLVQGSVASWNGSFSLSSHWYPLWKINVTRSWFGFSPWHYGKLAFSYALVFSRDALPW